MIELGEGSSRAKMKVLQDKQRVLRAGLRAGQGPCGSVVTCLTPHKGGALQTDERLLQDAGCLLQAGGNLFQGSWLRKSMVISSL